MKRIFIIHRWSGGPDDDWRPWLTAELQKRGYEVVVPAMPDTDTPVIEKWVNHIKEIVRTPTPDTFFVAHSIGGQAVLRYLETAPSRIGGAVFVSGWFKLENLEDEETEAIAKPWVETPIDFAAVKKNLPQATLIISDNDPYGAFEENTQKFKELGANIVVLHGAGHITADDGYVELPAALTAIEEMLQ